MFQPRGGVGQLPRLGLSKSTDAHRRWWRCAAHGESSPLPCSFGLRNGMVRAVVEKYAKTLCIEVILVGHSHGEIGPEQTWAGGQGQEERHSD